MCQWVTGSASPAAVGDGGACKVQSPREGSASGSDLEERVIGMKEDLLPPHEVKTGKMEGGLRCGGQGTRATRKQV